MKIYQVPYYCGGRIIAGLYNPTTQWSLPGQVFKQCTKDFKLETNLSANDLCPYLPNDFVEFLQILRHFCMVDRGKEGIQGVLYAVTNSQQTVAQKFLADAGFKAMGKYSKGNGAGMCITWHGDYRNDVYPILEKVPNYRDKQVELKNAKFSASTYPAQPPPQPRPPAQPMPNPFRDIAIEALRPQPGIQGAVRTRRT
jgi:hypothetical protein